MTKPNMYQGQGVVRYKPRSELPNSKALTHATIEDDFGILSVGFHSKELHHRTTVYSEDPVQIRDALDSLIDQYQDSLKLNGRPLNLPVYNLAGRDSVNDLLDGHYVKILKNIGGDKRVY